MLSYVLLVQLYSLYLDRPVNDAMTTRTIDWIPIYGACAAPAPARWRHAMRALSIEIVDARRVRPSFYYP